MTPARANEQAARELTMPCGCRFRPRDLSWLYRCDDHFDSRVVFVGKRAARLRKPAKGKR